MSACEWDPLTGRCPSCADEALPGRIVELAGDGLARIEMPNGELEVSVELVDSPAVGDVVLVHAGVAIGRVGPGPADGR